MEARDFGCSAGGTFFGVVGFFATSFAGFFAIGFFEAFFGVGMMSLSEKGGRKTPASIEAGAKGKLRSEDQILDPLFFEQGFDFR